MSKSNATEGDIISLTFHGTALPWAGDAIFYVALHTADPGEAGTQSTSECAYGAYARQAVVRDATGWDVSGNQASNDDQITFPECTSGSETATHVSIGRLSSGAGQILYSGALTNPIAISLNITPLFPIAALAVVED